MAASKSVPFEPNRVKSISGRRRWLELIRNLAVRDVETRYKHSLLGLYWALINPLVMAAIFSFVFADIFHASSKPIPYVVFLLTGLTFWNWFANAVTSATASITGNAQLLAKLYFPRVVLPTASVFARGIDFGFSFAILLGFILVYHVPLHWTMLLLPVALGVELFFILGISYLVAGLNVLYRDIAQLISLVMMVWMYLSPVMYQVSAVPNGLQAVLLLNPMGSILEMERDMMFTGQIDVSNLLLSALWSLFVFGAGLRVFHKVEPMFSEVM